MGFAVNAVMILFVFLFAIGMAFLIPGIVGTIITGKIPHSPKALRVLSILCMVFGIVICALAILIPLVIVLINRL